jgi:cysteine sulfinate desulfinase/cysteine desulfurase-like protein
MGVGLLIVKNEFLEGYKLNSQIFGSQQHALRGGTENIPLIAGAIAAMMDTFKDRAKKNAHMAALKAAFITGLSKYVPCGDYMSYFKGGTAGDKAGISKDASDEFIVLGCPVGKAKPAGVAQNKLACLPNTILISFAKNSSTKAETNFCNVKLKKALDAKKIIVSVGSACNTSSAKASHVLYAIRAPDVVKRGVIRISFSDDSKKGDVATLLSTLLRELRAQQFGEL